MPLDVANFERDSPAGIPHCQDFHTCPEKFIVT